MVGAIHYKWIPHPFRRPVGTKLRGNFFNGWFDSTDEPDEVIPDQELTEMFGSTRSPGGYRDEFVRLLIPRIEHWRTVLETSTSATDKLSSTSSNDPAPDPRGLPIVVAARDLGAKLFPQADALEIPAPDANEVAKASPQGSGKRLRAQVDWTRVEIMFLNDFTVAIRREAGKPQNVGYQELGFEDRRNGGGKPKRAWRFLLESAKKSGVVAPHDLHEGNRSKVEKTVQDIRELLQTYFDASNDPYFSGRSRGYQPRFSLGLASSFASSPKNTRKK